MKLFLPLCSLFAVAACIYTMDFPATSIFYALLILWAITGVALSIMILNARFRRKAKQAKMYAHLEKLIVASKGKFFSLSFTLPNGKKQVINGKNFYYSLLRVNQPVRYKFVDRNRKAFTQLKRAFDMIFEHSAQQ